VETQDYVGNSFEITITITMLTNVIIKILLLYYYLKCIFFYKRNAFSMEYAQFNISDHITA
jgi:hypothetical protein